MKTRYDDLTRVSPLDQALYILEPIGVASAILAVYVVNLVVYGIAKTRRFGYRRVFMAI